MGAKWSSEDDARVVELWETDRPTKSALPEFPGRTVDAIRRRASVLGLPDKRTAPRSFPNKARDYLKTGRHATVLEITHEMSSCDQRIRDALRTMVRSGEVHVVSYDGPHRAAIYAYGPGENAPKPEKISKKEAKRNWARKKAALNVIKPTLPLRNWFDLALFGGYPRLVTPTIQSGRIYVQSMDVD